MKQFYILANPEYFKKTMNWDMKHNERKYTEDKLVMFIASDYVPLTNIIEPYFCGWRDMDISTTETVYEPYCISNGEIQNDK